MSARRALGGALSATGVVLAALYAAPEPPRWIGFVLSLGLLVGGLLLLRRRAGQPSSVVKQTASGKMQWARELERAVVVLEKLAASDPDATVAEEAGDLRLKVFVPFSETADALASELGLQRYADVMIAFARSERALNRGLSAFVDGYPDEASRALRESLHFLQQTTALLAAES
ncbi:MAG TPA: hypothetical protein ENK07_08350 [Bacteroidetes bacterium]|nr:hypothetical protein [Bacteroidota bacterium]